MIHIVFGRYVATPEVSYLDHKNIFKKQIDHELPAEDFDKVNKEALMWLKDHYGFVNAIIDGGQILFKMNNYSKFVNDMHKIGLEVKVLNDKE